MNNFTSKINKNFKNFRVLDFSAFVIAILILLPIFNFLKEGFEIILSGNFSLGLTGREEIMGTLKILLLTSLVGGSLGVTNAWLLSNCDFKFRKSLRICQLIPLASPAYLVTAISQDLGSIMGYQITGLWWGILILSISTYPYVFILTNESFNKFGLNQILASRGLGVGPWKSFFRIALPMSLPALSIGISLMCMEAMNELGTFELLNIPTISTGIAENWISEGDPNSGIGLALVALIIVFLLIFIEKFSRKKSKRWSDNPSKSNSQGWKLMGIRAFLAMTISALPALFSLGIPLIWVALNIDQIPQSFEEDLLFLTLRTLGMGAIAAFLAVVFSLLLSLSKRWNKSFIIQITSFIAGIGYAIPGTVLAIFLLTVINDPKYYLYLLIWGYLTRFLTISKGTLDSALERIAPSIDEAATGLGANNFRVIKEIHVPLLKGPALVGTLLVFIDTIKELPVSFLIRPLDFDTLSVRIYQYATDGRIGLAILPAILITFLGLVASSTLIPSLENKNN